MLSGSPAREQADVRHRFVEQPVVSAVPAGDAAARIVEAVRSHAPRPAAEERLSAADLTLIATASATQQVAAAEGDAAPGGGRLTPRAGEQPSAPPGGLPDDEQGSPDVEELARDVYDRLERLYQIARERSGEPWGI
jgi:hypothetical protein